MKKDYLKILVILFIVLAGGIFVYSTFFDAKGPNTNYVKFTTNKANVALGDTFTLDLKKSDDVDSIKFVSSDTSIATVDENGVVTGVGVGDVTITASTELTSTSILVNVVEPVTLITINFPDDNKTLIIGDEIELDPVIVGSTSKVKYSVDGDCITIDEEGNVKALKMGNALVTGSIGEISDTINVVVLGKTYSVKFDKNQADSVGSESLQCTIDKIGDTCTVKAPNIYASSATVLGWGKDGDVLYKVGSTIKVSEDTTYFAMVDVEASYSKTYNVKFDMDKADSIGYDSAQCTINKKGSTCYVKAPSIESAVYDVIGWGRNGKALYKVNDSIPVTGDSTYYAILKEKVQYSETFTVNFDKGNASDVENNSLQCSISRKGDYCYVKAPGIISENKILGWGRNGNVLYNIGDNIKVTGNTTYFAMVEIKVPEPEVRKTFIINYVKNGASSISKTSDSCSTFGDSCEITLPTIYRSDINSTIIGWGLSSGSRVKKYNVSERISISEDMTLYAITSVKKFVNFYNTDKVSFRVLNSNYIGNDSFIQTNCIYYNTSNGCYIKTPSTATVEVGYKLIGYNSDKNASNALYGLNQSVLLDKSNGTLNFYPIVDESITDVSLYLSPNGSDNNSGLSSGSAILTLRRALNILNGFDGSIGNVVINIAPGNYYNQSVAWNYFNPNYTVRFVSTSSTEYPVFINSNKSTLTWFTFVPSLMNSVTNVGLSFNHIKVSGYFQGMSFVSNNPSNKMKGITLQAMYFENIGSKYVNTTYTSPFCIQLKNVSNASVISCKFYNLGNKDNAITNHSMHAINLIGSNNCLIRSNTFNNVDGNVISFRNGSNVNSVINNTFIKAGYYAFVEEDYYPSEAESKSNVISGNNLITGYNGFKVLTSVIISNYSSYTMIRYIGPLTTVQGNSGIYVNKSNVLFTPVLTTDTANYSDYISRIRGQ